MTILTTPITALTSVTPLPPVPQVQCRNCTACEAPAGCPPCSGAHQMPAPWACDGPLGGWQCVFPEKSIWCLWAIPGRHPSTPVTSALTPHWCKLFSPTPCLSSLLWKWIWSRCWPADGQLVSESLGGFHCRGDPRWCHDLSVGEHQQVHGTHTGDTLLGLLHKGKMFPFRGRNSWKILITSLLTFPCVHPPSDLKPQTLEMT